MMSSKEAYDKILARHHEKKVGPQFKYMTPSKAALFGLMVRFRDPRKGAPVPIDPESLAHDPYGNRHRMPAKLYNTLERRSIPLQTPKPHSVSPVYNGLPQVLSTEQKQKRLPNIAEGRQTFTDRKTCLNSHKVHEDLFLPRDQSWIREPRKKMSQSQQLENDRYQLKKSAIELLKDQTMREIAQLQRESKLQRDPDAHPKLDIRPARGIMMSQKQ